MRNTNTDTGIANRNENAFDLGKIKKVHATEKFWKFKLNINDKLEKNDKNFNITYLYSTVNKDEWCLDSGCQCHMSGYRTVYKYSSRRRCT